MELALATAIGMLTAIGIYLLLRARSFDVILGMTFLSYATNLLIFAGGRVVLGKAPVLQEGVDSHGQLHRPAATGAGADRDRDRLCDDRGEHCAGHAQPQRQPQRPRGCPRAG